MGNLCYNIKSDENLELKSERPPMKPTLICFFEHGNEEQKNYCIKLKDHFQNEKTINYEIKSIPKVPFLIKIIYKDKEEKIKSIPKVPFLIKIIYKDKEENIQEEFNNSDSVMEETLRKAYDFLNSID